MDVRDILEEVEEAEDGELKVRQFLSNNYKEIRVMVAKKTLGFRKYTGEDLDDLHHIILLSLIKYYKKLSIILAKPNHEGFVYMYLERCIDNLILTEYKRFKKRKREVLPLNKERLDQEQKLIYEQTMMELDETDKIYLLTYFNMMSYQSACSYLKTSKSDFYRRRKEWENEVKTLELLHLKNC